MNIIYENTIKLINFCKDGYKMRTSINSKIAIKDRHELINPINYIFNGEVQLFIRNNNGKRVDF